MTIRNLTNEQRIQRLEMCFEQLTSKIDERLKEMHNNYLEEAKQIKEVIEIIKVIRDRQ